MLQYKVLTKIVQFHLTVSKYSKSLDNNNYLYANHVICLGLHHYDE